MQNKLLVIQQFFGLGDCVFAQTIANDFIEEGYKVLWPVEPHFVEGLNRAYPNVIFIDRTKLNINYENKEFKEIDGMLQLPMRYSESLMGKPYKFHMESKYSFLGKNWRTWKSGGVYKRDSEKESNLMKILGIDNGERYNLVSTTFGSGGQHKINISVNNEYKSIEMQNIEPYSLFDWSRVIENAEEIHAVSSASLYLFELLDLSSKSVHLYVRKPIEQDFGYVDFLFTKKYILHQ